MSVIKLKNILAYREEYPVRVSSAIRNMNALNWFMAFLGSGIVLVILVYMITAPVHVDEGWFHNLAKAKNDAGYYTFPAFHDVPGLEGPYTHGNGLFVQFYRLLDWLVPGAQVGIIAMRLVLLGFFVAVLWLYLARLDVFGGFAGNVTVMIVILLQPVVLSSIARARPELLMATFLLLIFYNFRASGESGINWDIVFVLSIALFLVHPNGILYLLILMVLGLEVKNTRMILRLWGMGLVFAIVYYMVFIDANYPLYKEQFTLMFSSGGERKFLGSLNDVPWYIYSELRDRYLLWEWRGLLSYPFVLVVTVGSLAAGLYSGGRHTLFRREMVYVLATMIFFLFLGNKFPGYLTYIFPVLLVMCFYSIRKRQKIFAMASILLILVGSLWAASRIVWNIQQRALYSHVLAAIHDNAAAGELVYAPLRLEPYLSGIYEYRTTTQKGKYDFYRRYSISPRRCLVVERKMNNVWKHVGLQRETIYEEEDLLVQRIH